MIPDDLVGTLGAMPAEWSATSDDVAIRSMFYGGTDPFPPQPLTSQHFKEQVGLYHIRVDPESLLPGIDGLKPEDEKPASPPPLKWRGLRRVHAVNWIRPTMTSESGVVGSP